MTPSRLRRALPLALLCLAAGCLDGAFTRANPNDEDFAFTMQLVSDRDTLSPAHPVVIVQVVTDPVITGYQPDWSVTGGTGVLSKGNGVFELSASTTTVQTFEVTARFQHRGASRTLYRAPAP